MFASTGLLAMSVATIIGSNDLEPARAFQDPTWQHRLASVVRVSTTESEGYCSGFLIGQSLVMTNEHCASRCDGISFELGYDEDSRPPRAILACDHLVLSDYFLDFAIFDVRDVPSGAAPLTLSRSQAALEEPLLIAGHPEGQPKQVDRSDACRVIRGPNPSTRTLYHRCDTLSGSSGSPIFNRASGHVVGLHNRSGSDFNAGLHMSEIASHISEHAPDVYRLLTIGD